MKKCLKEKKNEGRA
jgi:hypothetical protein